jgi:glutamine amidotransferase
VNEPGVTVVDYGMGNLFSVQRALEYCGANVRLSSSPGDILVADRIVLPGVGAFADGMKGLQDRGLIDPLREFTRSGRPVLGICLGMQMLASTSEEFGEHQGLGLIPGRVVAIPALTTEGKPQKIPYVGWNEIYPASGHDWRAPILQQTAVGTPVYLVHSFHMTPDESAHVVAHYRYGGHRITAAVGCGSIFGAQFHPEKSGKAGLSMLAAFLQL